LRSTLKRGNILLLILFFFTTNLFSNEDNYYSVNKIVSFFKLEVGYDSFFDTLTLKKLEKSVVVPLNMAFIYIGKDRILTGNFTISEQGQYFIPIESAIKVIDYFSFNKDSYYIQNGDIFVGSNNKSSSIDISNIQEDEKESKIEIKDNKNSDGNKVKDKNLNIYEDNSPPSLIKAIILDPGHGGKDPGAVGYNDIKEKDIVLRTGLILKDKLEKAYPNKKIFMTRSKDNFVELEDRAKKANEIQEKYGQSIFVAIHVNASMAKNSFGFETWYLVNNYSRNIVKKGEVSQDRDVENIVNSMLNEEIYRESKFLAQKIQARLEEEIGYASKNRGIKEEIYFVIKKSVMPAVLVEIGFNTNKYEAIRLTNYSYLDKIAKGILEGVKDFIAEYEKTHGFSR